MVGHVAVHFRGDFAFAEGIVDGRVEAGSHQHQLGIELQKNRPCVLKLLDGISTSNQSFGLQVVIS